MYYERFFLQTRRRLKCRCLSGPLPENLTAPRLTSSCGVLTLHLTTDLPRCLVVGTSLTLVPTSNLRPPCCCVVSLSLVGHDTNATHHPN